MGQTDDEAEYQWYRHHYSRLGTWQLKRENQECESLMGLIGPDDHPMYRSARDLTMMRWCWSNAEIARRVFNRYLLRRIGSRFVYPYQLPHNRSDQSGDQ